MQIENTRRNPRIDVCWPAHMTYGRSALAIVEIRNMSTAGARLMIPPRTRGAGGLDGLTEGSSFKVMLFPRTHAFYSTACSLKWMRPGPDGTTEIGVSFHDPISEADLAGMLAD
jgi:hypothetical protein